ncbi:hypothetical protein BK004_00885 [bacterium CG10_46_32]|nr:MAG: hypothetical protein BK004_00885 [bacterium CG10_46_32]PIR56448.1 MAG: hypothetical protein COU73_00895 [Parcubacteria group bacterium CG10_big_fil_rev_8_21_14_0_10_46_32]
MFEDQNQHQHTQQPSESSGLQQGVSSGVEDIFAGTDAATQASPQSPSQPPSAPQVIPGPPTALASGKLKPLVASGASGAPLSQTSVPVGTGFPFKKMMIIILISIGVVGVAVASFAMFSDSFTVPFIPKLGSPQDSVVVPVVTTPTTETQVTESPAPEGSESNTNAVEPQETSAILKIFQQNQVDKAQQDPASLDTDQDGLSDAQEFSNGTNPRLVDSDNDGLSDWEEIAIFGTNPLNVDSDGDSYVDGQEVQNGYNPLGPGKLLNFEKANSTGE